MEAAFEAAFSCPSTWRAIPTSARAKDGASFMPSPTFKRTRHVSFSINSLILPRWWGIMNLWHEAFSVMDRFTIVLQQIWHSKSKKIGENMWLNSDGYHCNTMPFIFKTRNSSRFPLWSQWWFDKFIFYSNSFRYSCNCLFPISRKEDSSDTFLLESCSQSNKMSAHQADNNSIKLE